MHPKFKDIYLVFNKLITATNEQIIKVEKKFGFKLPESYIHYITFLGEGLYSGFIRIYLPDRIKDNSNSILVKRLHNDILNKYDFDKLICIGDSMEGDQIVFCPEYTNKIFICSRHFPELYFLDEGLYKPMKWSDSYGNVVNNEDEIITFESSIPKVLYKYINARGNSDIWVFCKEYVDKIWTQAVSQNYIFDEGEGMIYYPNSVDGLITIDYCNEKLITIYILCLEDQEHHFRELFEFLSENDFDLKKTYNK